MPLSRKQQRFVTEYLVDLNATQAAIRSGYSAKTAMAQGSRLLSHVEVSGAVQRRAGRMLEKAELTAAGTVEQLRRIVEFDIADLYNDDGQLKPVREWPEHARSAVAGVEVVDTLGNGGEGEELIRTRVSKVKLLNRTDAIKVAMQYLKLIGADNQVTVNISLEALVIGSQNIAVVTK
jgi:phage terminase small subunit